MPDREHKMSCKTYSGKPCNCGVAEYNRRHRARAELARLREENEMFRGALARISVTVSSEGNGIRCAEIARAALDGKGE